MPSQEGDCSVPAPHSASKKPSGDSCQSPSGGGGEPGQHPGLRWPPRLAADPTTLNDKHPHRAPTLPCGTANRVEGRAGATAWEGRVCAGTEGQSLLPTARRAPVGSHKAFNDCATYPARSSLGTAAGAHGADGDREQAVQRVTDPSEAAASPAVAVAVGGGHGWRSRCQQQCLCPCGRGGVGRGWGGDINI